jgi:hypothetical protein
LLEKLAEQMEALSRSELDRRLASLWLGCEYLDTLIMAQSELLRSVGFHWEGNADDFVNELVARLEREGEIYGKPRDSDVVPIR